MKLKWQMTFAAMALSLAIGCNGGGDTGSTTSTGGTTSGSTGSTGNPPAGKKLRIAVIPKGSTHEYWKSIHEGADKAAAELGCEIIFKGPMKEDDREDQIKVVDDQVSTKVDGIVLAPLDNVALARPANDAVKAGIKVVIIDSGLKNFDALTSMVATDNRKAGQMAGEALVDDLKGIAKPRVIMLRYEEGSASTMEREEGFMDVMKKHPEIDVVSSNQYAGATTESAAAKSENILATHKKGDGLDIDGIYTPNESSTFGMLRTLQNNHWAGKVKFQGFDASAKLVDALKAGEINGLILQNPRKMGYLGVKTLVDAINGKTVEKNIDTGATLVTKANMDQPAVAELLAPPKE